jgi:hypothetical protein
MWLVSIYLVGFFINLASVIRFLVVSTDGVSSVHFLLMCIQLLLVYLLGALAVHEFAVYLKQTIK